MELDELDQIEAETVVRYKPKLIGFRRLRVAFFPSRDKIWQNPIGALEIYLTNPSKAVLAQALSRCHKLRWLQYQGKTFYTNASHLTHYDMALMIGEPNPTYGIGGFLTAQMLNKIPPDMDIREWENENATAVR